MNSISLKAVIIDDETESLDLLVELLSHYSNVKVIGCESDPDKAVDLIVSGRPDIVFLDVKMPGKSGFDILDDLYTKKYTIPYIVFTTAYDEFAIKAFEYSAFDYLLKPVELNRLSMTIERCSNNQNISISQRIKDLLELRNKLIYRSTSGITIINPSDVAYIKAEGNYSTFVYKNGKSETITLQLGRNENQLSPGKFFRISRTFIINLTCLKKIVVKKRECILWCNGLELKCLISESVIKDLLETIKSVNNNHD